MWVRRTRSTNARLLIDFGHAGLKPIGLAASWTRNPVSLGNHLANLGANHSGNLPAGNDALGEGVAGSFRGRGNRPAQEPKKRLGK